ncbi:MAG: helicase-exonuclease AddAB subunit AddA [Firmicutes bacterium]|nr:helicase-exonuclease AddAB subunit AddA [Bacillota bacterium]
MSNKWTPQQWQAITTRGTNLLVAAGAGAGKTAVLVERIIRRITDPRAPINVDQLLVVTFTNAAAAEMRERIGGALTEAVANNPEDERLARQLALLGRASIATLHSFCLDLLRQYFYRVGLDPAFRVADATEAELLRIDVLEQLLEEKYQTEDETFLHLVDAYGGSHDDGRLQEIILQLDKLASSQPDPEAWLEQLPQILQDKEVFQDWLGQLGRLVKEELLAARNALRSALAIASQPDGPEQYIDCLQQELLQVEYVLDSVPDYAWDELRQQVRTIAFARLPSKRGGDKVLREQAKQAREEAKKCLQKLEGILLAQSEAELVDGLAAVVPAMELLCQLVCHFRHRFAQAKQQKGLVDFNDLEHLALRILREGGAVEVRQRYAEILVDEYQDINGVQEAILQLVADPEGKSNQLFMVGDVKQSIYRFRLADPTLFLHKYKTYGEQPQLGRRIDLAHNFRSRPSVLAAVNFLFRQLMTETVGELAYDTSAELVAGANYPEAEGTLTPQVEVMLLERSTGAASTDDEEDPLAELYATSREARCVAQAIRRLVEEERPRVWDKQLQAYRPLAYRDIVILLRVTQGRANTYLEQLRQLEVPAYAELGSGYFQATEVQTMLSLLQIIDNPRQDIPLAAVLRSPLVGLSGAELAQIRLARPQESFYEAVLEASSQRDRLGEKLRQFLADLDRWREEARRKNLSELIWQIYRDTGYFRQVGAMPGGAQRQANLRALHDRARQYEQTSFRGLFRFLRFIERLQAEEGDLGTAPALGENDDVVRIMSVHKSKGLEFPVVFVGGMGNQFNLRDLQRDLLVHKELGLGPMAVDLENRVKYPTLPRLLIEQRLLLESLSEELRVLYVALTRAREKLYLVGAVRNRDRTIEKWLETAALPRNSQGALPDHALVQARRFLDWVGPALVGHPDVASSLGVESHPRCQKDPSRWRLHLIAPADLTDSASSEPESPELASLARYQALPDKGWSQAVAERLSWEYPYAHLQGKHIKVTVSELKRRFETHVEEAAPIRWQRPPSLRPAFLQQQAGPTPTELGTAIHLLLQHVDLQQAPTLAYLEQLQANMVANELLSPEMAAHIDLDLVIGFLESELGHRLRQADQVWRELPFSLRLPASELYGPEAAEEQVFVQGIVDSVMREGEQAVLIDFKSDQVTKDTIDKVAAAYRVQMEFYGRAITTLLGLPVKERYLYFLRLGQAVRI